MILKSILAGTFKLDGGAMFGVVPKKIWSKLIVPDANNLCTWALRCLYVEDAGKKILIDTGMGNKQEDKFFSHYEPEGTRLIDEALFQNGVDPLDITDVILSHLHFDHCGGAFLKNNSGDIFTPFPNADFWVHESQWLLALNPNPREKASFLKENINPLVDKIKFIDEANSPFEKIEFIRVSGHSEGMVLPIVQVTNNKKILFGADLFPSIHHIPLPYIMAYDMQPLITLQEKIEVLHRMVDEKIALFFEHDPENEIAILDKDDKDRFIVTSCLTLRDYLRKD